MGIFLSISNTTKELSNSQKLYPFATTENNEIIIDPGDFRSFIKVFRGLQCKKEDTQIELRNVVLEWKSRLRRKQQTKDTRTNAYELIETVETLHDEQDAILESENKKLELLVKDGMLRNIRGRKRIYLSWDEEDEEAEDSVVGEFDDMKKEISRRRQYLQTFNKQSTSVLKMALVDLEECQKMVDISEDFGDNESEDESSATGSEEAEHVIQSV